jgi:hypothetical protein
MNERLNPWMNPLGAPAATVAVLLGLPGCLGPALGLALRDWPVPFGLQLTGDIGLRTVIYGSGFLAAFGLIGLATALLRTGVPASRPARAGADSTAPEGDPEAVESAQSVGSGGTLEPGGPGTDGRESARSGHVSIAEPFYGFLPRAAQLRLARDTGYHALLYTKVSILLSAGVGVLLAGSWETVADMEPLPPDAVLRIGAGLYLIAESARRYVAFSRGEPTGTLIGALVGGALGMVHSSPTSRS